MKSFKPDTAPQLAALLGEPLPSWKTTMMERRPCIVCGFSEYTVVCYRPDSLSVAECSNCSSLYLPVIPNDKELAEVYKSYSNAKAYMQNVSVSDERTAFGCLRFLAGFLRRVTKRSSLFVSETCELLVRTGGLEGKRILEIGPGKTGGILPETRMFGGEGIALEIDSGAAQSIAALGFHAYSDIADIPQKVDIIHISMVLEHLRDPLSFVKRLSEITVPEGRILIRVPNAGQARALGRSWIGFRVDLEHLNYFEQESLTMLLRKAGYLTECVWLTSQPILPQYLPMADRNRFISYAQKKLRRNITCSNDPFLSAGEFMLTVLARKGC